MKRALLLAALAAAVFVAPARAQTTYTFTGGPITITDSTPAGVNMDIVVTDSYTVSSFISMNFTFGTGATAPNRAHSWIGDVIATLTHVDSGFTIDLFRRVGGTSGSAVGDSSNLSGSYTLSNVLAVSDVAAPRLFDESLLGASAYNLRNGVYRPTTNSFAATAGVGETITNLNTTFDGVNVNGTWRLFMSDNAAGDIGDLQSWSFTVNGTAAVPEPATLALGALGMVGALGAYRQRRRRKLAKKAAAKK